MEALIRARNESEVWVTSSDENQIVDLAGSDELIILRDGETPPDALHRVKPHPAHPGLIAWTMNNHVAYQLKKDFPSVTEFYVREEYPQVPQRLIPEIEEIAERNPETTFIVLKSDVDWGKPNEGYENQLNHVISDNLIAKSPGWYSNIWRISYDRDSVIDTVKKERLVETTAQEAHDRFLLDLRRIIKDRKAPKKDKVTLGRDSRANHFTMPLYHQLDRERSRIGSFKLEWPARSSAYSYEETLGYIDTLKKLHPRMSEEDIVINAIKQYWMRSRDKHHPLLPLHVLMQAVACFDRTKKHAATYYSWRHGIDKTMSRLFSILKKAYYKELKKARSRKGYRNIGAGAVKRQAVRDKKRSKALADKRRRLRELRAEKKTKVVSESTYEALLEQIS